MDNIIFNTAILYDIENLIGGYGRADMLSSLSLKEIHDKILEKEIGKIAVQRAYANWSNPKLNILRGDIIELGIEPVQMFGFGRGSQKNASDIHLVIDAMDIVFTREAIKIFIVVSGDGGFSTLAKKLHEYGCMVIGCAFRKTANRVFQAVCDDFIWIEAPKDDDIQIKNISGFTDPILIDFAKQFESRCYENKREEIFEETIKIFDFLVRHKEASYSLTNTGINISLFSQALSHRIEGFNYMVLGFVRFVDFISYISHKTKIKLVYRQPSEYRLLFQNTSIKGFEAVEPITELQDIHTVQSYKLLLSKGVPVFKLPRVEVLYDLVLHLSRNGQIYHNTSLGDIIENISSKYDYEQNDIKACILSLISAKAFIGKPEDGKLSEREFTFVSQSSEQIICMLKNAMYQKLNQLLGEVHDEIFIKIFS